MRPRVFAALTVLGLLPCCAVAQVEGDNSLFIKDVNFPDGTKVKPGQEIKKEWQIKNIGSVTWQGRYLEATDSSAGEADAKAIKRTVVPTTKSGELCTLKATLTAPQTAGTYKVTFKLVDKGGKEYFPNKSGVYIEVVVE